MERKRFWTGIGITILWILAGLGYFYFNFQDILKLKPNEHGDFAAGFFAPMAFLWLVLGYLQQGEELQQNTAALRRQGDELELARKQAEHQAKAISANELHARKDTFLRVADLTIQEMFEIAVRLGMHVWGAEYRNAVQIRYSRGERSAPYYDFLTLMGKLDGMASFYESTPGNPLDDLYNRLRSLPHWLDHISSFLVKFEFLISEATACDPEGHLRRHFETSMMGRTAKLFKSLSAKSVVDHFARKD